ncbi:hypothetical protein BCR37DRAFT_391976 [Protomyces lactucae-debilis]|uniref:Hemimethylated DNA-binding domain-containing protein n=1 Tax=Protomyces lactucae-debilis TaxID=2754530 RepID=A0A1Y2FM09_PROLT|nr:uncharacterized protein BCR37DRAFT_391976 [Protomyces lactucae-debilis]ORY84394.1 hypothetical protein BCR37DRAFT_391976 [Protomyces lactucae-debilis]
MSSVFGLVLETMHDNDLCVDHVLPCEFPDLESNFISDSLLGRKPASPIVFTVIFCAVAKRIGLLAAPIVVGDFVMAKICYKQDGSNRERFMDVCNDGQLFTIKALYELLQPYGATREMVLEGSKAIQGPMLVKYCAHSIFECLQGDSSNLIDYLAVVRCFHWCDHPTDIVPLNIAYILGEMDHFSTTTWLEVLPQLAKLSGYTKENARHASEVLQAFQNVKNHALSVARRSNPERAIRFALGSLVRHRKHKYLGVIHGHDDECKQSQKWQEEMRVSKLKGGGPNQPFYYIRKTDGLDMYVAERNLEIVSCDRCGDRQADVNNGSKVLDADYLPCIMKLERLPSESNLGQIVKARKNKGACGYVPGSDIQQQYPASLWPPMPNACSQRSKP